MEKLFIWATANARHTKIPDKNDYYSAQGILRSRGAKKVVNKLISATPQHPNRNHTFAPPTFAALFHSHHKARRMLNSHRSELVEGKENGANAATRAGLLMWSM